MTDSRIHHRNILPNEITYRILNEAGRLEDDMNFPPHVASRNTYTRFVLTARQVSRLWRDIVDMRSCYWFRVSSTRLLLEFASSEEETPVSWVTLSSPEYDKFQDRVQAQTSMLVINLIVTDDYQHGSAEEIDAESLDPHSRGAMQKFLLELAKLPSYQERILQLDLEVPEGTFLNLALAAYRSFDHHHSALRRAKLETACMRLVILNQDSILETFHTPVCRGTEGTHSPSPFVTMSLTIPHDIEISPRFTVTHLHLLSDQFDDGHPRIEFARFLTIIASTRPHLQSLTARVVPLSATVEDLLPPHRPSILLPSLVTMEVHVEGGPSAFTNLLLELDCPNLENVNFPESCSSHELYISRRADLVTPTTCLPRVKEMSFFLCGDQPFFAFEALSLPSLESLEFFMDDDWSTESPSSPVLQRLAKLHLRSLTISASVRGQILVDIFSSFNLSDLRYLHIGHWDQTQGLAKFYSKLNFPDIAMPHLQYLVLECKDAKLPVFSWIVLFSETISSHSNSKIFV